MKVRMQFDLPPASPGWAGRGLHQLLEEPPPPEDPPPEELELEEELDLALEREEEREADVPGDPLPRPFFRTPKMMNPMMKTAAWLNRE